MVTSLLPSAPASSDMKEDWRAHTIYQDISESHPLVAWFWRAVESFPEDKQVRAVF
jgi:hypothetical protein